VRRIALIVALVLISGCAPASSDPATPGQAEETSIALPPRPRDIRIDGIEPCSLLTEQQRLDLGLDGQTFSDTQPSRLFDGDLPLCSINGFSPRAVSVGIGVVTTVGIEAFSSGKLDASINSLRVAGYPAVVATPRRFDNFCEVLVDVAPGQLLNIQYADGGREPPIPQDQLCRAGRDVAAAAMETLLAR